MIAVWVTVLGTLLLFLITFIAVAVMIQTNRGLASPYKHELKDDQFYPVGELTRLTDEEIRDRNKVILGAQNTVIDNKKKDDHDDDKNPK